MSGNEYFACNSGIQPLEAVLSAAKESAIVYEDTTPQLDGDIAEDKEALEEQVNVHLLLEKSFG